MLYYNQKEGKPKIQQKEVTTMMTMTTIRENYKGYTLMAIDNCDFYWEEFMGNWSAVGEYGWNADDADIEGAGIDHVSVDESDKIVYIYLNDQP